MKRSALVAATVLLAASASFGQDPKAVQVINEVRESMPRDHAFHAEVSNKALQRVARDAPVENGWAGGPQPAPADWRRPPHHPAQFNRFHESQHQPPEPWRVLLEKAFELERIAHELEMHGFLDSADTLRAAADQLRSSARKARKPAEKEAN